ncbi:hypothetical protein GWI33_011122 [Rhynchophorus ferrugineus]|uniref:BCAS3 WD40 domain-containing protein n=1 Tax=Rhynchophorus ferrugineus TaxID=354439 RepID=A0A834MN93_RHYFE|nr:hypothetical protein GWI33_011122 [Rhynchophorus ferrugineus]
MSADSPNHTRSEPTSAMQNTVTPQPVTDPTILDSVAGFINEVVPTTGNDTFDIRDQIQWARFENLDWDESNFSINSETQIPSSLILVLGYTTGIQVWAIPANGEAIEIFSWRHGSVKLLRILPTPYKVGSTNKIDAFELKRPLIALIDVVTHGSSASSLNFYSLKTGEQVKQIKFKNQILDVLANRRSVIITFPERIAVFDAFTLEDKLSLTGCYLSPGIQQNPVALGPRWLAYADKKLIASRRSSGGNEGEGVQSYTATVLHAAKSLGRGLRELGDAVASSLTGNQTCKLGTSPNSPQAGGSADIPQKGIVTIMDIESPTTQNADGSLPAESVVAHFVAHSEAIVWLQFGPCGMLLLTADKRGHDFNLFRINPHPLGSSLAAIHHLYTLHRGDTSARVQDMCFSFDSRWVTVSTLRGTTHVFPITPYGGNIGVRTHTTPHVVNKMSRFHRSAGLTGEGRSNSPVSMFDAPVSTNFPYHNPRFAPFPHPTVINPLAQLRQPVYMQNIGTPAPRQGRQRLTSSSEDNIALRITACFAPARAWIDSLVMQRETALNKTIKPVDSLFVMNCHGTLVQYDLEPHCTSNIPKERICDDSPIELTVIAKAQWRLQRQPMSVDRPLPVPHQNLLFVNSTIPLVKKKLENGNDDDWLSQVEIITHAGPHRRLWMGPQFTFKTYTTTNGTPMSLADAQPLDLNRSKPVNMPITKANAILIESSSASSSEQSLLDIYKKNCEEMGTAGEHQIKEDLADAMIESPGVRESGGRCVIVSMKAPAPTARRSNAAPSPIAKVVNPLGTVVTVQSDEESDTNILDDVVIYENCDETLFRPLVSPKALAYCKTSNAPTGNIMTQSLRADTEVTVRVLDKYSSHPSSWEDPNTQDLKGNTRVIVREREITDILIPKENETPIISTDRKKNKSNQLKDRPESIKSSDSVYNKLESINREVKYDVDVQNKSLCAEKDMSSSVIKPVQVQEISKQNKKSKSKTSTSKKSSDDSRSSSEREQPYTKIVKNEDVKDLTVEQKTTKGNKKKRETCKNSESIIEDMSVTATINLKSSKNTNKEIPPTDDSSSSTDNLRVKQELEKELDDVFESTKKTEKDPGTKTKREKALKTGSNILKNLDIVEDISFPALDDKLVNPEFPPLEENFFSLENIPKVEHFEDAEDCGLPLETVEKYFAEEPKPQSKALDINVSDIGSSDTVSTSEDNIDDQKEKMKKKSPLKLRKSKAKLGVKIQKSVAVELISSVKDDVVEAEITLPPPKKSWSSIVAQPQKTQEVIQDVDSIITDQFETYTATIPKKVHSNVTTEKLLDIETPEERQDFSASLRGNLLDIDKSENFPKGDSSADLLKLSDKSSDDEKNESGSSPTETTESSDEGKTVTVITASVVKPPNRTGGKKKKRR